MTTLPFLAEHPRLLKAETLFGQGEHVFDMVVTDQGARYLLGITNRDLNKASLDLLGFTNAQYWLCRLDANGESVWIKGLGDIKNHYGCRLARDNAGHLYVTGYEIAGTKTRGFLTKFTEQVNGQSSANDTYELVQNWSKTISVGGPTAKIQPTSIIAINANVIVGGSSRINSKITGWVASFKTGDGAQQWLNPSTERDSFIPQQFASAEGGDVYIAGRAGAATMIRRLSASNGGKSAENSVSVSSFPGATIRNCIGIDRDGVVVLGAHSTQTSGAGVRYWLQRFKADLTATTGARFELKIGDPETRYNDLLMGPNDTVFVAGGLGDPDKAKSIGFIAECKFVRKANKFVQLGYRQISHAGARRPVSNNLDEIACLGKTPTGDLAVCGHKINWPYGATPGIRPYLKPSGKRGAVVWSLTLKEFGQPETPTGNFGSESDDIATAISVSSNGLILGGNTSGKIARNAPSFGNLDVWLKALNFANPNEGWVKQFGSWADDRLVAVVSEGNRILATGTTQGELDPRHDNQGKNEVWLEERKVSDGERVKILQFGSAGADLSITAMAIDGPAIFLTGTCTGEHEEMTGIAQSVRVWLAKFQSRSRQFERDWYVEFGSNTIDFPSAMAVAPSGSILLAGTTLGSIDGQDPNGKTDIWLANFDAANGQRRWIKQFGSSSVDAVVDLAISDQAVFLTGQSLGSMTGSRNVVKGSEKSDIWLARYKTDDGTSEWIKQFGSSGHDMATGLYVRSGGTLVLAGVTSGSFGNRVTSGEDIWIAEAGANDGALSWVSQISDPAKSILEDAMLNAAGDRLYLAGSQQSGDRGKNAWHATIALPT